MTPTRQGYWVTTSHRVCDLVLRDRRFGVRPAGDPPTEALGLSFLEMNPPDHTRLRRLAQPARRRNSDTIRGPIHLPVRARHASTTR